VLDPTGNKFTANRKANKANQFNVRYSFAEIFLREMQSLHRSIKRTRKQMEAVCTPADIQDSLVKQILCYDKTLWFPAKPNRKAAVLASNGADCGNFAILELKQTWVK
jgi:hypothetical protein